MNEVQRNLIEQYGCTAEHVAIALERFGTMCHRCVEGEMWDSFDIVNHVQAIPVPLALQIFVAHKFTQFLNDHCHMIESRHRIKDDNQL